MKSKLPKWLTVIGDGVVSVNLDLAYPVALEAIGVDEKNIDQYAIEVAYQTTKMTVQELYFGSEYDKGKALDIRTVDPKNRWSLKNYKPGRGIAAATKGREAKAYYNRVSRALMDA